MPADELLTIAEVAAECRVTPETAASWCLRGRTVGGVNFTLAQAGAYKAGQNWRIPRAALDLFIRHCTGAPSRELAHEQARRRSEAERLNAEATRRLDRELGKSSGKKG